MSSPSHQHPNSESHADPRPASRRGGSGRAGVAVGPGRTRRVLGLLVRLGVCAVLMAWIFHAIFHFELTRTIPAAQWDAMSRVERWKLAWTEGPTQVVKAVSGIRPGHLVLSLLVMGSTLAMGVVRWRMVLRVHGLNLAWGRAAEITLVSHFFNSFLLGSAGGDVMRAIYAARETHHKKTEAVITVLVDRLLGFWALLMFGCLMMLWNLELIRVHRDLRLLCGVVVLMAVVATLVLAVGLRGGVTRRWGGAREWLRKLPKGESMERALEAFRRFGQEPLFLIRALGVSMLLNLLCVLHVQVIAQGLGMPLEWSVTALIVPAITAVLVVPITPSGLGVRENLFVYLLNAAPLNLDATQAFALSLVAYGGSLCWSLVGGVVYLTLKRKHHLAEVAEAAEE